MITNGERHLDAIVWIQLFAIALLGTTAQLALKTALNRNGRADLNPQRRLSQSPLVWTWFGCYMASTLLWLLALRVVPLSQAFPVLGLQFALVPLASKRFLDEDLVWIQWVGVGAIVIGVAIVGQS
jgi:undecaprenyl phosphate-alpha-L-ara4N flippase subunit ArnE